MTPSRIDPMFAAHGTQMPTPEEDGHTDLVRLVRRVMRGRILIAIVLMLGLGIPSAIFGYTRATPVYRSIGQVHVRPLIKPVLDERAGNQLPPMFASYVAAQASLLRNPRTQAIARAILQDPDDPIWSRDGTPPTQAEREAMAQAASPAAMRKGLRIIHRGGEEVIEIWYLHENPLAARLGVQALLAAYERNFLEDEREAESARLDVLQERYDKLDGEVRTAQLDIDRLSEQYLTDDLRPLIQARVEELARLDLRLRELEDRIMEVENLGPVAPADEGQTPDSLEQLDAEVLALRDQELARLIAQRDAARSQIESMSAQFGPQHLTMRQLRAELASLEGRVAARAEQVRDAILSGQVELRGPSEMLPMSLELLRKLQGQYRELRAKTEEELKRLSQHDQQIRARKRQLADLIAKRDEAAEALERISLQEKAGNKIGYVRTTAASEPEFPYADKRKAYALMAGGAGAAAGLGIVVLWGLMHRKYRYIEDLSEPNFSAPLLGCLPDLSRVHPEHDEVTAWSIHQIRNLLQARAPGDEGRGSVFCVTSPQSGDGKTSLALALAISFAKGGKQTLIVDLDLVGRGLTKQLRLTEAPGVRDAIGNEKVNGEIHPTQIDGLSVLPAGAAEQIDEASLSRDRIEGVLAPLRERFAAIIVDTGPVLGSLEANLLCPLVDSVVLTITRGESEELVETSLQRVRWLGAQSVGLVFNRASRRDMEHSHSHSLNMSMRSIGDVDARRKGRPGRPAALLSALGAKDAFPDETSRRAGRRRKNRRNRKGAGG